MTTSTLSSAPVGNRLRTWFQAIRFFSFTASVVPILVGSVLAWRASDVNVALVLAMLVASVACQAGANLANDFYDHRSGVDTFDSLGPSKVIQQGLLSPTEVRRGMVVAFALATAVGVGIAMTTDWVVFWLAFASLAIAYGYTAGPKPLGYIALGEIAVFFAMGPAMVVGSFYVLTGHVSVASVLTSIPIGFLVAAILHANNIRDIEPDRGAGKRTLATILGRRGATIEFTILVVGAYLLIVAMILKHPGLWPVGLTGLSLPLALNLIRATGGNPDEASMNRVLRQTAGLHLRFGFLLIGGLLIVTLLERT